MSKIKSLTLILGILLVAFLAGRLVLAWVEPSATPPGGNVEAPINASLNSQIKAGALQVNGFRNIGNTIFDGTVGIGDTTPASLFTVGSGDLFQVNSSGDIVKIRNITYSWPAAQGAVSTCLTNNGSGTLSWGACGGVTWPLLATDGTAAAPSYSFSSDTNTGIYRGGTDILRLVTTGTDRVTIDASGNVGIGSTGPDAKLDVLSTSTQLRLTYIDGSVYTNFTVDSSGNLTISPSGSRLFLAASKGLVLGSNASDLTGTNGLMYYNSTNNKFRCYQNGGWTDCIPAGGGIGGSGTATQVAYFTAATTLASSSNLYWDNTNTRLGIGIASPGTRLDIRDTGTESLWVRNGTTYFFAGADNTNKRGRIGVYEEAVGWKNLIINEGGGNVGIGTTSPASKLEVSGNIAVIGGNQLTLYSLGNLASANYEGLFFMSGATSQRITSGWSGTGVARPIVFDFNGAEKMRITSDGNVGIGTDSPGINKLKVAGDGNITSNLTVGGIADAEFVKTDSSGKLVKGDFTTGAYYSGVGSYDDETANDNCGGFVGTACHDVTLKPTSNCFCALSGVVHYEESYASNRTAECRIVVSGSDYVLRASLVNWGTADWKVDCFARCLCW